MTKIGEDSILGNRYAEHDPECRYHLGGDPCRQFSTDGTWLGAQIAHSVGTSSEVEIVEMGNREGKSQFYSDVDAEQADWDADELG